MNKRVEGSFTDLKNMQAAIQSLLEEGYTTEQLLIIARDKEAEKMEAETGVEVMVTHDKEDSLWDKVVSLFTVNIDEEEEDEEEIFEDYGIEGETYDRFEEALDNGEYLLLVDAAPPVREEHADFMVRDGIIPEEEDKMDENKKNTAPDWSAGNGENGDMPKHSVHAEQEMNMDNKKKAKEAAHQAAHPDPEPGVTEQDNVVHEIPQSESPDPVVNDEGEEVDANDTDPSMEPDHKNKDNSNDEYEPSRLKVDPQESHPETEMPDQKSKDPFGLETEPTDKGNSTEADARAAKHAEAAGSSDDHSSSEIKVDPEESHPEEEMPDQVSKDPFGLETEAVDKDEGGEAVKPHYEETDNNPPAL